MCKLEKHFHFFVIVFKLTNDNRHDVAGIAGLIAMSFGIEGVNRYIIVYKKDRGPSEDEVSARREGEEWNELKAKEYAQKVKFRIT